MINNLQVKLTENNSLIFTAYLPARQEKIDKFWTSLSRQEKEQAEKFMTKSLKERYILSHGLLRHLLAHYLTIPPQNIQYVFNEFGKPFLGDDSRIQFNMSHSKDRAAYIISLDHQVGIDIEWKDKKIDISDVSKLVLTPAEVSSFNKLSLEERFNTFYDIWTKKEAIIKAIGQGLSYPIRKIEVMNSSSSRGNYYKSESNKYYYLSLPTLGSYAGAIAIAHKINELIHLDMVTEVISCYIGGEQEWL